MKKIFIFILTLLLCFSGCGKTEPVFEYEEGFSTIKEPCGKAFLFPASYEETFADGNTYRFAPDISIDERAAFIKNQQKIFDKWNKLSGFEFSGFTFWVLEDYSARSDSENKAAFFGIEESGTYKQVLGTVLMVLGDFSNYGYAYALADSLSGKLGFEQDVFSEYDNSVFTNEPERLNLNYACFSEKSSSEAEINSAKALSIEIFENLENPYGGEAEFSSAIFKKAADLGIDDFSLTYLGFAYGGESCPLRIRTKFLDIMIDKSYQTDCYVEEGYTDTEWTSSVSSMIFGFEEIDAELSHIRSLFHAEDEYLVPTCFLDEISYTSNGSELWGLFQPNKLDLLGCGRIIIIHEYVHYLFHIYADFNGNYGIDNGTNPYLEAWHGESIAYYFGSRQAYDVYTMRTDNFFEIYESAVGHPLEKPTDIAEYVDAMMHASYRMNPKATPKSFTSDRDGETISFGGYFARTYGEQTFVDAMLHPGKCKELTGKNFSEIEDDWEEYIMHGIKVGAELEAEIIAALGKE